MPQSTPVKSSLEFIFIFLWLTTFMVAFSITVTFRAPAPFVFGYLLILECQYWMDRYSVANKMDALGVQLNNVLTAHVSRVLFGTYQDFTRADLGAGKEGILKSISQVELIDSEKKTAWWQIKFDNQLVGYFVFERPDGDSLVVPVNLADKKHVNSIFTFCAETGVTVTQLMSPAVKFSRIYSGIIAILALFLFFLAWMYIPCQVCNTPLF